MKTLLSAVAISATLATAAFAGSPATTIAPEPLVVAPAAVATDWSGFYLGAGYSGYNATEDFLGDFDGNGYSGFAGYNIQRGSIVFGGELEVSSSAYDVGPFADDLVSVDLKARAGYAFGSAMVYGLVGATTITSEFGVNAVEYKGYNYGVGAAYQLDNGLFLGLEYMIRDLEGTGIVDGQKLDAATASIRVGWQF